MSSTGRPGADEPHVPEFGGASVLAEDGSGDRRFDPDDVRWGWSWPRQARLAGVLAAASLVLGVVAALLWVWLSSRPAYVVVGSGSDRGVALTNLTDDAIVGRDGWFAALTGGAGLLCGIAAARWVRRDPVGGLVGLVGGGVLGALVAWRLGLLLAPEDPVAKGAKLAVGAHFHGGLKLRATGLLLAWPIVASAVVFVAAAGSGSGAGRLRRRHRDEPDRAERERGA